SGPGWRETAHDAVEDLDAAIEPGTVHPRAGAIDEHARLPIVQRSNHYISPAEITEPEIGQDIADERSGFNAVENPLGAAHGAFGFAATLILFSKKHRAAQVAQF